MNNISNKQELWCNDIKKRITVLRNAYVEKSKHLTNDKRYKVINRIDQILKNAKTYYIIDEYKGISDEFLIRAFELKDTSFCNFVESLFLSKGMLYEIQQKKRLEQKRQLDLLFKQYAKPY